jgi:ATP-dependent Clp protease ATP-binding subunit ClpA
VLSAELEYCLNLAFHQARTARHEFITVEHLLLAILGTPKVREVLEGCGADVERLGADLRQYLDGSTPRLNASDQREVQPTIGFQRVLQRAVFHVQSSGKKEVGVVNVLVAIFSEKQSYAALELAHAQVTRLDVVNFNSHGVTRTSKAKDKASMDAAGLERPAAALLSLRQLIEQAPRIEEEERADIRELIDDLIAAARAKRPNGMKLRGLVAGLASGVTGRVDLQAWSQVRNAAIALDLWIIE